MIGKTIQNLLSNDGTLLALIPEAKMFPYVMNENTDLPALIYTIDSVNPEYNKDGWALDNTTFSVHAFSRDYSNLQSIVSAIRGALEWKRTGYGTESIGNIYLSGVEEGFDISSDVFFNKLTFVVRVNGY